MNSQWRRRAAGDDRGRSERVAQLPVLGISLALLAGFYVNDQPVEGEAQIVHLDARASADKRIRAVRSYHPARADCAGFAGREPLAIPEVPALDFDVNAVCSLCEALSAPPLANFDIRKRLYMLIQYALRAQAERNRGRWGSRSAPCRGIDLQRHLALGATPLVGINKFGDANDICDHAGGLKNARDSMARVNSTRKRVEIRPAFNDDDFVPQRLEQDGPSRNNGMAWNRALKNKA